MLLKDPRANDPQLGPKSDRRRKFEEDVTKMVKRVVLVVRG